MKCSSNLRQAQLQDASINFIRNLFVSDYIISEYESNRRI